MMEGYTELYHRFLVTLRVQNLSFLYPCWVLQNSALLPADSQKFLLWDSRQLTLPSSPSGPHQLIPHHPPPPTPSNSASVSFSPAFVDLLLQLTVFSPLSSGCVVPFYLGLSLTHTLNVTSRPSWISKDFWRLCFYSSIHMSLSLKFTEHFIPASVHFCPVFRCLMISTPPVVGQLRAGSVAPLQPLLPSSVHEASREVDSPCFVLCGAHGLLNILGSRSQKYCAFRHALQFFFSSIFWNCSVYNCLSLFWHCPRHSGYSRGQNKRALLAQSLRLWERCTNETKQRPWESSDWWNSGLCLPSLLCMSHTGNCCFSGSSSVLCPPPLFSAHNISDGSWSLLLYLGFFWFSGESRGSIEAARMWPQKPTALMQHGQVCVCRALF